MAPPIEIKEKKLLLVEGADAYYFTVWACQAFNTTGIQVLDFGGISELSTYLSMLKELPNYEKVETIVIARDAENNPDSATQSIRLSLRKAGLAVPAKSFEFKGALPRVAYMIFTVIACGEKGNLILSPGRLEDLCLETVKDDAAFQCVDQYKLCLQSIGQPVRQSHKFRLHAYLAGKNFAGLKIGEAAKAGVWNWDYSGFEPYKRVIMSM